MCKGHPNGRVVWFAGRKGSKRQQQLKATRWKGVSEPLRRGVVNKEAAGTAAGRRMLAKEDLMCCALTPVVVSSGGTSSQQQGDGGSGLRDKRGTGPASKRDLKG